MIISLVIFSGISYATAHESFFNIDSGKFNSSEIDRQINKIEDILDISAERKNIVDSYSFNNNSVDRDVFLYKLLSVSGYNLHIEDALDDALGLNLIDNEIYDSLIDMSIISPEIYEGIMLRYLYFDLKNKDKNIIYYMADGAYLDSTQLLLEGGVLINDVDPELYFKSNYYYIRLPSKDILKSYYLGLSKKNLLMDRSTYMFVPHINHENFYDMDFFMIDRLTSEYISLTDKMSVEFDSQDYRYYPSKKRFWANEKKGDASSFYMNLTYRDEKIKILLKREVDSFIMIDHGGKELEPCSYYFIRKKHEEGISEIDKLIESKRYQKSYIGIRYRDDKNPTLPIYFNKPGSSNYYYEADSSEEKYNVKVFVFDEDLKPYKGYLSVKIRDRSGREYKTRLKIKADGLVNLIFYDNRFNRMMDICVEDLDGNVVSDLHSVNSKSNDNLIISIKQE